MHVKSLKEETEGYCIYQYVALTKLTALGIVVLTSSSPMCKLLSSLDSLLFRICLTGGLQGVTPISSWGSLPVFEIATDEGGGGEGDTRFVGGGGIMGYISSPEGVAPCLGCVVTPTAPVNTVQESDDVRFNNRYNERH